MYSLSPQADCLNCYIIIERLEMKTYHVDIVVITDQCAFLGGGSKLHCEQLICVLVAYKISCDKGSRCPDHDETTQRTSHQRPPSFQPKPSVTENVLKKFKVYRLRGEFDGVFKKLDEIYKRNKVKCVQSLNETTWCVTSVNAQAAEKLQRDDVMINKKQAAVTPASRKITSVNVFSNT